MIRIVVWCLYAVNPKDSNNLYWTWLLHVAINCDSINTSCSQLYFIKSCFKKITSLKDWFQFCQFFLYALPMFYVFNFANIGFLSHVYGLVVRLRATVIGKSYVFYFSKNLEWRIFIKSYYCRPVFAFR